MPDVEEVASYATPAQKPCAFTRGFFSWKIPRFAPREHFQATIVSDAERGILEVTG